MTDTYKTKNTDKSEYAAAGTTFALFGSQVGSVFPKCLTGTWGECAASVTWVGVTTLFTSFSKNAFDFTGALGEKCIDYMVPEDFTAAKGNLEGLIGREVRYIKLVLPALFTAGCTHKSIGCFQRAARVLVGKPVNPAVKLSLVRAPAESDKAVAWIQNGERIVPVEKENGRYYTKESLVEPTIQIDPVLQGTDAVWRIFVELLGATFYGGAALMMIWGGMHSLDGVPQE